MTNCKNSFLQTIIFSAFILLLSSGYAHSNLSAPKDFRQFSSTESSAPSAVPSPQARVHDFTRLPLTQNGWTDFKTIIATGYEDARVIFVSSSEGDDSTGQVYGIADITFDDKGMFQPQGAVNAYKTIAQGYRQLRNGYPDILLLKRGDAWEERFHADYIGVWAKAGYSPTVRMIMASYGSGSRPTMLLGNETHGFVLAGNSKANNLIFSGIKFYGYTWENGLPTKQSVDLVGGAHDILFEDIVSDYTRWRLQGFGGVAWGNIAIRRCIFIEGSPGELHAKLYTHYGDNFLLEESTFYSPTLGNRHFYFDGSNTTPLTGVQTKGNIFYHCQRTGLSHRATGTIDNNLILRNDLILAGGAGSSQDEIKSVQVMNNVFLESVPGSRGDGEWGIALQNNDGSNVYNNIWTDPVSLLNDSRAITLKGDVYVRVARNINIYGNVVHGWTVPGGGTAALDLSDAFQDVQNVNIYNNDFQMIGGSDIIRHRTWNDGAKRFEGYSYANNRYYSPGTVKRQFPYFDTFADWLTASGDTGSEIVQVSYPDATRTLKTYNQSLGGTASTEEFMLEALKQARHNWRAEYTACAVNNYIRAGFDKESIGCGF